jgi:Arc/MetJ-type ribon-helix-helix transcriptional regulator
MFEHTLWRLGPAGGSFYYRAFGGNTVSRAVKKAISLPADLAAEVEAIARDENKSLSAVVQDALRALKRSRLRGEFRELQGYWSNRARAAGILSERDLERLLRR